MTRPTRSVGRLSDPALRWSAALYDPRTLSEEPAVPHGTAVSQKVKVFARGSFSTGTTGYGFVTAAPFAAAVNDSNPIIATAANSVFSASGQLTTASNTANINTNSPFTTSQISANTAGALNYKLVGAALYVKYAGTELNRGGDMVLFEENAHRTAYLYSYTTAMGQDFAKRVPVSGDKWQHVCYTPNSDTECEFGSSVTTNPYVAPFLAIIVNSAGTPQPFDYEFYGWYEFIGNIARGATSSYQDTIGYAAVVGAANQFQQLDSELGIDGFLHSINNQMDNFSGVARQATHQQNFAGLAAFLPQILSVAKRAGGALAKEFLPGMVSSDPTQKKAMKQLVKTVVKGKPPKAKPKKN